EKEKFQNYRLLWARVLDENGAVLPSWFLGTCGGSFDAEVKNVSGGYAFAENVLFMDLWQFNKTAKHAYKSVKELIFSPPTLKEQKNICAKFSNYPLIIVVPSVKKMTYKIQAHSIFYEDVREVLATF
ncbi:MAG: hypothetical protein LBP40_06180, partial [Campylobacteraceae bacterium]|nr:hypothetical protein [Campylobacteraceae bacterium]